MHASQIMDCSLCRRKLPPFMEKRRAGLLDERKCIHYLIYDRPISLYSKEKNVASPLIYELTIAHWLEHACYAGVPWSILDGAVSIPVKHTTSLPFRLGPQRNNSPGNELWVKTPRNTASAHPGCNAGSFRFYSPSHPLIYFDKR